jgi:hypothetical protein
VQLAMGNMQLAMGGMQFAIDNRQWAISLPEVVKGDNEQWTICNGHLKTL